MSLLSDFEDRVGRAVEGMFAGVFRAPVQPAELARTAAKEMDRRKKLGVGKVFVPTVYSVLLSPEDGEQLGGFSDTLAGELETYLVGYAAERDYALPTRPRVRFLVDEELKLGRHEVIGEFLSPQEIEAEIGPRSMEPAVQAPPMAAAHAERSAVVPSSAGTFAEAGETMVSAPVAMATVTVPGVSHDVALTGVSMTIGRLKSCDICLQDANASREHATLERDDAGWAVRDLESTNGTLLNGKRVDRAHLHDGDVVTVGITELVFHQPRTDTP